MGVKCKERNARIQAYHSVQLEPMTPELGIEAWKHSHHLDLTVSNPQLFSLHRGKTGARALLRHLSEIEQDGHQHEVFPTPFPGVAQ